MPSDDERTITVGLVADPGLPSEVAAGLVDGLPGELAARVSDDVRWRVDLRTEALTLDADGNIPIVERARAHRPAHGWDVLVCITDLPRRLGTQPVIGELNAEESVVLASLPAVGSVRLRRHLRDTIVYLLDVLTQHRPLPGVVRRRGPAELMSPVRHRENPRQDIDASITLVGLRGQVRLLAGMVRDNRPWRLVPSMSSALAAAMASAAFGVFFSTIWTMADALSPLRLAGISLFTVCAMVAWLILYNGLWERRRTRDLPGESVLYNVATVLTLFLGVTCMYVLLFVIVLTASGAVIAASYMSSQLGHPVGFTSYAKLAWLASSMGITAGALGSSLETEDAVRQATYSKRERERRERRRQQEKADEEAEGQRSSEDD
ncbi:hypothetical protein B0I33_104550 [Prauserella shujinwangii]|uniref:DUF2267 domain-containing protein n=1 Tax=Prauserella shujinwangii TaxID=1453103 RepID=A0A2T0LXI1_9PSEU|nr:hypothetical protein [Prauserella shujinwangii]PRX48732.1 hypothetical protein B0I33_104550 [Prauserella shujinwangii]